MSDDKPVPRPAGSNVPATRPPLSREALERVLARAAELQLSAGDPSETMLTEEQLVEVGEEVGLAAYHVRQALAEERARVAVPEERGLTDRVFGGARVVATRTVNGTPDRVFAALEKWLAKEECLRVQRRLPEWRVWEPQGGLMAVYKQSVRHGGHGYHLSRAREVTATAVKVDENRCVVRLEADLSNLRKERIAGGAAAVGTAGIASGILVVLNFVPELALVSGLLGTGAGYMLARTHIPAVTRAQMALEGLLDRLERSEDTGGEPPQQVVLQLGPIKVVR